MTVSGLFLLTLVLMEQVCPGLALTGMRSTNRHAQEDTAVVVSAEASFTEPADHPMSRGVQSESHDTLDRVVVISAGASFSEPISALPISSPQAQQPVQRIDSEHLTPLGAAVSELPIVEPPVLSSQGQKLDGRRGHEHLPPLGSGSEAYQMTSVLLEGGERTKSSLTAENHSQMPAPTVVFFILVGGLAAVAIMVLLVLKLMKARQDREVNARLMATNESDRGSSYVSRRSKKVVKAQAEDEAAAKIQSHFRIFVQRPSGKSMEKVGSDFISQPSESQNAGEPLQKGLSEDQPVSEKVEDSVDV